MWALQIWIQKYVDQFDEDDEDWNYYIPVNWDQDKHDEQLEKPLQMDVESLARLIQDEKKI